MGDGGVPWTPLDFQVFLSFFFIQSLVKEGWFFISVVFLQGLYMCSLLAFAECRGG